MDVVLALDVVDGPTRVTRYNNVPSWIAVLERVAALFNSGGEWHRVYFREFRMKRVDKPEATDGDTP